MSLRTTTLCLIDFVPISSLCPKSQTKQLSLTPTPSSPPRFIRAERLTLSDVETNNFSRPELVAAIPTNFFET